MIAGLGDTPSNVLSAAVTACGADPCSFWDDLVPFTMSDECSAYLSCSASYAVPLASSATGAVVGAAGSVVGSVAGSTISGILGGISSSTGIPVAVFYIGGAVAAYFLLKNFIK